MPNFPVGFNIDIPVADATTPGLMPSDHWSKVNNLDKTSGGLPKATATTDGLMSHEDKAYVESLRAGGGTTPSSQVVITLQTTDGTVPDADIIMLSGSCAKSQLPAVSSTCRKHYLFHNISKRVVKITPASNNELFGYPSGFALGINESVQIVIEPNTTRWRAL